mgnify:CR=1 FL=1
MHHRGHKTAGGESRRPHSVSRAQGYSSAAITTAVGIRRSTIAAPAGSVPSVSLGMLSTFPSLPTKVEEPPPSRLTASVQPSEINLSASSGSVNPLLPRLLRPSHTNTTSLPSAVAPIAVRGWRERPETPPWSSTSRQ